MVNVVKKYISRFGVPIISVAVWMFLLLYVDLFSGISISLYSFSISRVTVYIICGILSTLSLMFPPFHGEKHVLLRLLWAVLPLGLPVFFHLMSIHFFWALFAFMFLLLAGGVCYIVMGVTARKLRPRKVSLKKQLSGFWMLFSPVWGGATVLVLFLFLCFPYPDGVTPSTVKPRSDLEMSEGSLVIAQAESIGKLEETTWTTLAEVEKLDVLQVLLNIETTYLGIDPVKLCSDRSMTEDYLGLYLSDENRIHINRQYLCDAPAYECVRTVCHEARHAYQQGVVDALDWSKDAVKNNRYFSEAANWREEFSGYISGFENYEHYYSQSVESDARDYAQSCVEEYFQYVKAIKQ